MWRGHANILGVIYDDMEGVECSPFPGSLISN